MKKIVSTMFKCGAIFASLNTAFADEDLREPVSMAVKKNYSWGGSLEQFLIDYNPPLEEMCQMLWYIADELQSVFYEAEILKKKPNWNLTPNVIHMFFCPKPYVLHFSFLKESVSTLKYNPDLFSGDPGVAFACLMLYFTHPEIRPYFEEGKVAKHIIEGKYVFQRWSDSRKNWVPLEGNFTTVRIATLLLNNEITLDQLMDYLASPETYNLLIKELKIIAEGTTFNERENAVARTKKLGVKELFVLVAKDAPELLTMTILTQALDRAQKDTFCESANEHQEVAEKLAEKCSTQSVEKCKAQGKIQISERAMEILREWYGTRPTPAA